MITPKRVNMKLTELANELEERDSVRAIVLTGAGDKAFCAGADLKERRGVSAAQTGPFINAIATAIETWGEILRPQALDQRCRQVHFRKADLELDEGVGRWLEFRRTLKHGNRVGVLAKMEQQRADARERLRGRTDLGRELIPRVCFLGRAPAGTGPSRE